MQETQPYICSRSTWLGLVQEQQPAPPRALQHERGIFDGVLLIMVVILVKVSHCACLVFSCGELRHHPVSRKPKGLQQTAYLAPCVQPSAKTLFYINIIFFTVT